MCYKDFEEYGSLIDCYWKLFNTTIQVKISNKADEWTVDTSTFKVNKVSAACMHALSNL